MLCFAAFAALVAVAVATPAGPPAYGAPAPYHAPAPHHAPAHYDESPKPYAFQYGVADDYSGAKFNAQETTDAPPDGPESLQNIPAFLPYEAK